MKTMGRRFARFGSCLIFLGAVLYHASSTAQASCAVGVRAPAYSVLAKALSVSPSKTTATFKLIRVKKGKFPWKQFAATSNANLPHDFEVTTIPEDPDHPRVIYSPTFEPGETYSLIGNNVAQILTFRGQRIRLDIWGSCSQSIAASTTTAGTIAPQS